MATEQGLFRQEVMDARRGQWLGAIHLATPLSRWVWTTLGVSLAGAIVVFLVFGHYTRRDRAAGQLVPDTGLLAITANHAGTVTHVYVHAGERIRQGQPLVEISGEQDSATLGGMRAAISKQLRSQRKRLKDNLRLQKKRSRSQADTLRDKLASLKAQQQQIVAQLHLQKQQADDAETLLKRTQPLQRKGYVSALQIQQQQAAALQARTQLKTLRRQELGTSQQIRATQQKLAQLPLDRVTQAHATASKIDDIDQQLAQNETARAAGFVEPGSRVVLRYQGHPCQKFDQSFGLVKIARKSLFFRLSRSICSFRCISRSSI